MTHDELKHWAFSHAKECGVYFRSDCTCGYMLRRKFVDLYEAVIESSPLPSKVCAAIIAIDEHKAEVGGG